MEFESCRGDERLTFEGQLLKFTNVVKGFQYRWFTVNNKSGTFEYFEKEDQKNYTKPRGFISLVGAEIIPSAECPYTFLVNSKVGTFFKLKALNTKERQEWINNLRKSVSYFTTKFEKKSYYSTSNNGSFRFKQDGDTIYNDNSNYSSQSHLHNAFDDFSENGFIRPIKEPSVTEEMIISHEPFKNVANLITQLDEIGSSFSREVETLPSSSLDLNFCDKNLLLSKASSAAAIDSLKKCLNLLRNQKILYWKIFNPPTGKASCPNRSTNNTGTISGLNETKRVNHQNRNNNCVDEDEDDDGFVRDIDGIYGGKSSGAGSVSSLPAAINSMKNGSHNNPGIPASSGQHEDNGNARNEDYLSTLQPTTSVSSQSTEELNTHNSGSIVHSAHTRTNNANTNMISPNLLLPIEDMSPVAVNPINLTEAVADPSDLLYCRSGDISEDADPQDSATIQEQEQHKTVLQHLISQIRLGMDLTKVALPSFLLEKRSLLEMFADFMTHPDLFIRISEETTPEKRMRAVVIWYLTAFHAGKKSGLAKKPYNPIIGETFHCMWHVPTLPSSHMSTTSSSVSTPTSTSISSCHHIRYTAEQVSHHPPITALYLDTQSKSLNNHMQLSGCVQTRSKFQGMSVTAQMLGKLQLKLTNSTTGRLLETYQFTLPNAHARNILSVPRLELGDKVTVTCPTTKYSASIVFHSKNLFGSNSQVDRISGEIKDPDNRIFVKITGDWNKTIELLDIRTEEVFSQKVSDLIVFNKYVNKLENQHNHESRKLWKRVTDAIQAGDMDKATKHKTELEIRQRQSEKSRISRKLPFPVKYFHNKSSTPDNNHNDWLFRTDISYKYDCNIDN